METALGRPGSATERQRRVAGEVVDAADRGLVGAVVRAPGDMTLVNPQGQFLLRATPATRSCSRPNRGRGHRLPTVGSDSGDRMKTDLEISHLTVEPGRSGRVEIDVTNTADVIDGVTAIIDGINPDWIRLDQPLISLFPESTGQLALVFDIPLSCPAGDYLVIVRIVSTIDADRQTVHDFWLTVEPAPGLAVASPRASSPAGGRPIHRHRPQHRQHHRRRADRGARSRPRDRLHAGPDQPRDPPGPGRARRDRTSRQASVVRRSGHRTITVTARTGDVAVEELVTFRQRARIPRGLLTVLILASIVLLWALIFLFVVTELRRTEAPAKAVGTDFLTGPENIPIARVAATIEGTVTATTTGAGVPRITVEALAGHRRRHARTDRLGRHRRRRHLSAAEPDPRHLQGPFQLAGYQTVWFPSGGDAATAEEVRLDPLDVRDDLNVEMVGDPGELFGQIAVPPDAVGTPLTVTATQVVERDDGSTGGGTEIPPVVTTDGTFTLTGLATPATYLITVTGDGFQTQQFEQALSGGQATVLNTVQLSAATGTIGGTVRNRNRSRSVAWRSRPARATW